MNRPPTLTAQSAVIWDETFDGTRAWNVIAQDDPGSSVNISGGQADFYVDAADSHTSFGPTQLGDFAAPINTSQKGDYTLYFIIDSLSWSTSYQIALDEFDSSKQYVNTVWQVYPPAGNSTDTGTISVNLGSFTFHGGVEYVAPKLDMYTGDGAQTITFDRVYFDQAEGGGGGAVPEPGSIFLMVLGAAAVYLMRSTPRMFKVAPTAR
ncbi:MAG: PEP-CTERM sorting domain-containing protein [Verrucomicrobia bacterium]|nr:PEP-CTERM sorting domain-containing protein [Verrucomicrobiota bacterium]